MTECQRMNSGVWAIIPMVGHLTGVKLIADFEGKTIIFIRWATGNEVALFLAGN
jgi:hypothetical protein